MSTFGEVTVAFFFLAYAKFKISKHKPYHILLTVHSLVQRRFKCFHVLQMKSLKVENTVFSLKINSESQNLGHVSDNWPTHGVRGGKDLIFRYNIDQTELKAFFFLLCNY